jgi:uncharacterized DUF497 family protein
MSLGLSPIFLPESPDFGNYSGPRSVRRRGLTHDLDFLRYNSYTTMEFEFDPRKNESNIARHGVDFVEAQELWDSTHVIIPARHVRGEQRYAILGFLRGELHLGIFTRRKNRTRLITCHRADQTWERIYAQKLEEN